MIEQGNIKEDIFKILRLLASGENSTQRDLSSNLGFSLGKTNYLVRSLIKKGLIEIRNLTTLDNRLKKIHYILTPKGFEHKVHLAYYFLKKKEEEYMQLKREING